MIRSATSNKMDTSRKKLNASDEELSSRFYRARSSTCEGMRTLTKDADQLCLRPSHSRSRTLNSEPRGPRNFEAPLQQKNNPLDSPLAARKFGGHMFGASLPSSLPCSVTNSPRFARRNSDFMTSKQVGLSVEDFRRLSGSLSELEKGKLKLGRQLMQKRPSLPCSVTNSPRFAKQNSDVISSKQAELPAEDIRRLTESLSLLEKAKPRPQPYEEKPFYLCPENGSFRRNYWKSESMVLEQRIVEAQNRRVSRVEEEKVQERPLADILPPLALSSIYAQESSKAKRKEAENETKRKTRGGVKNGSNKRLSMDVAVLTKDLSDCRYLRIPNNSC